MQSNNPFFDELARLMTGAAGAAQGVRREIETLFRSQGERLASELELVRREEFEARLTALEARLTALEKTSGIEPG